MKVPLFTLIKKLFAALKRHWTTKFRLVIKNDDTHKENFSFRLTPRNIFVVMICSTLILIMVTSILIAFTPLRYYIPGYTNPDKLREFRQLALKYDHLETQYNLNQTYLEMLNKMLKEETGGEDESVLEQNKKILERDKISTEDQQKRDGAVEQIKADAKNIKGENSLSKISDKVGANAANDNSVMLQSPAAGSVVSKFDARKKMFGIAISNNEHTPIICIADGVIVYSGFDPEGGNTLIVQHAGNLMSIYKHNTQLYKTVGSKVKAGETIASMGSSGKSSFKVHLWFELWYNGVAVNPQEYLVIQP